uniref:CHASE2 domain-containing protein n=1 Tax=Parastrongyloides trichosuri TaxID=131310 RepID=A0A0N5A4J7_PARTI
MRAKAGPADENIVIIAIDDRSLEALGQWPWPRDLHARLIDRLTEAGAGPVAYDVLFTEPSSQDDALAAALARNGKVRLPVVVDAPDARRLSEGQTGAGRGHRAGTGRPLRHPGHAARRATPRRRGAGRPVANPAGRRRPSQPLARLGAGPFPAAAQPAGRRLSDPAPGGQYGAGRRSYHPDPVRHSAGLPGGRPVVPALGGRGRAGSGLSAVELAPPGRRLGLYAERGRGLRARRRTSQRPGPRRRRRGPSGRRPARRRAPGPRPRTLHLRRPAQPARRHGGGRPLRPHHPVQRPGRGPVRRPVANGRRPAPAVPVAGRARLAPLPRPGRRSRRDHHARRPHPESGGLCPDRRRGAARRPHRALRRHDPFPRRRAPADRGAATAQPRHARAPGVDPDAAGRPRAASGRSGPETHRRLRAPDPRPG